MSTNVPTISVTSDNNKYGYNISTSSNSEDNSDSNSNDIDYNSNISGGFTEMEDFDSNAEFDKSCSRRSSKNNLFIPKANTNAQGDMTDVEDYNDSEMDEEDFDKSSVYSELKISLEEFLQHDIQEHLSTTNGNKEAVKHKSGNFLKAQNLDTISDYMTDCEEYNTDSDIETACEKSAFVDLDEAIIEQGKVEIADIAVTTKDREIRDYEYEDASVISDISDLASAVSDAMEKHNYGLSEDEFLELSGNEEICQISCSDSDSIRNDENLSEEDLLSNASLPPIDVTFIQPSNKSGSLVTDQFLQGTSSKRYTSKGMFFKVEEIKKEEVLTDIERFDDSVAEDNDDGFDGDDDNQQPIPQAVILAIGDDGACQTDCEDILIDDISEATGSDIETGTTVDNNTIPLPHREVVLLQENKYGNTITNVMPMGKEYQFGIYETLKEERFTDTEEFSCAEDDIQDFSVNLYSRSHSPNNIVMVESDVTVANEVLKSQQSKRLEIISNAESVTDVEEIFMAGTNSRKKKVKTRNMSRNKSKYLETPKTRADLSEGGTDIEDMDLSESGLLPTKKIATQPNQHFQSMQSLTDKFTDVEEMTADDASSISEIEHPHIDSNFTNLKYYHDSSKNCIVSLETCGTVTCTKHSRHKKIINFHSSLENEFSSNHNQQQYTDIEDVQLPSDAEQCSYINEPTLDSVCPELNEMLNECCTTVYDKSINSFNVDAEKLHVKGMPRESHTDIEYVESDESAAKGSN